MLYVKNNRNKFMNPNILNSEILNGSKEKVTMTLGLLNGFNEKNVLSQSKKIKRKFKEVFLSFWKPLYTRGKKRGKTSTLT